MTTVEATIAPSHCGCCMCELRRQDEAIIALIDAPQANQSAAQAVEEKAEEKVRRLLPQPTEAGAGVIPHSRYKPTNIKNTRT